MVKPRNVCIPGHNWRLYNFLTFVVGKKEIFNQFLNFYLKIDKIFLYAKLNGQLRRKNGNWRFTVYSIYFTASSPKRWRELGSGSKSTQYFFVWWLFVLYSYMWYTLLMHTTKRSFFSNPFHLLYIFEKKLFWNTANVSNDFVLDSAAKKLFLR